MKNGLTFSMIFEAQSANYGEGFGNISTLKKLTRSDGKTYTYISRQAIRYNIINQLKWDNTPVMGSNKRKIKDDKNTEEKQNLSDAKAKGVIQFAPLANIKDYPEIDLFGYMKTKTKSSGGNGADTRSAVVRLSNAVSLEEYNSDMDFLNNMGLAKRINLTSDAMVQNEIHKSMYSYTITVDLDRIGIDKNSSIEIDNGEKAKRVKMFLEAVEFLYRDIKGRRENLNPIFVMGGLYERKNPYFEDRLQIKKGCLNIDLLKDIIQSCEDTKNNTLIGCVKEKFGNPQEIEALGSESVSSFFEKMKEEVDAYYESYKD
ncbi:MAG: type I-B CRISPR-associated protein Cas7/Cst2/DevR [Clostridia bacterium]|jgi:CRISPR-associated protein Cst2|nr:type I-B CRISPR-associated protein Cas7/Cst2/DevR [Clostridia bacterium]MCI2001243.1 type I-B CRISPR-associated protein Cas7/Cst2/DevR [Clostridia bacterium]MCI2015951.1 type I-B CRISPR-associated protein Cas7/Cst2/DevR [Clostridia bacterium]